MIIEGGDQTAQFKGPDSIRQRMDEIRARISGMSPGTKDSRSTFDSKLKAEMKNPGSSPFKGIGPSPEPLAGDIGSPLAPFDPSGAQLVGQYSPAQLKSLAEKAATKYGIDPRLFDSLVEAESSYDPMSRSRAGAMGLTQLMPNTAADLGVKNSFDPVQNLEGGAKYLSQMLQQQRGNVELALAAYNAGPGAVQRAGGIPNYKETKAYVSKIMARYRGMGGQ